MSSIALLAVVACLIAIPGIPASLIAFPAGDASTITRVAAAFGLGYTVSGGCAFILAAAHLFRLGPYLVMWLVLSAALWVWAFSRGSLPERMTSIAADLRQNRLALIIGAVVLVALLVIHLRLLYVLGGPRYVYYLNGIEIANSHGVPAQTLEYGQSWPPATDKIYLDAFSGLLMLLNSNVAIGPGVLLLLATFGAFVGLWAAAWELGLRRTAVVLPLLYIGNTVLFSTAVGIAYTDYRAEDFGRAVAFCALAVGIAAIRTKGWRLAVAAGVILAAASGTHLIPVVVVVLALCLAGLSAVLFRQTEGESRFQPVLRLISIGAISGVLGVLIRAFAGGNFGLEGAQNPAGYSQTAFFDPTAYLYGGSQIAANRSLWNTKASTVISSMMTGNPRPASWELWLLIGLSVVAAAVVLLRPALRPVGVVGLGMMVGLVGVGLFFALSYDTYIEQTFGIRRLTSYVAVGFLLLVLGLAETIFDLLAGRVPRVSAVLAVACVVGLSAWLLPASGATVPVRYVGNQRTSLINWVRTSTPCDARFLINQRTEGTFTALTGRFALLEGMGAFLRTKQLPYVVSLLLKAQKFFHSPGGDEQFLRRHDINYVVVADGYQELGYAAPIGPPNTRQLGAAPYLQLVYSTRSIQVYRVIGARTQRVSALLTGQYLHCLTSPVRY